MFNAIKGNNMSAVLESVTFRLTEGTTAGAFTQACEATFAWVRKQPGFMHRVLCCDDAGQWSDQVLWTSMAHAQAASEAFMNSFGDSAFMAAMDPDSVKMQHSMVHAHS
jgi:hypothetical protein